MLPLLALLLVAPASDEIGPPPGKLFGAEGSRLHLHCTGAGQPTVVIEAGASSFALDFALVQPELAKQNRVCSYDRAGHGWSDGVPDTRGEQVVAALHALLREAREKPPFVLVGASFGGLYVRLYQARHPQEVAGLVLVDPAHEDRLFVFHEGQAVTIAELTAEQLRSTFKPGDVRVPRRPVQTGAPFDRLPAEPYRLRQALDARLIAAVPETVPYELVVANAEGGRAMFAELRAAAAGRPLGERPLVVLTRGAGSSQAVKDVHASMAKLTTNFRHSVVAGAGHEIHLFEPSAVVLAVQDVLTAVKAKQPLPQTK